MISIPWQNEHLKITVPGAKEIRILEPHYPSSISFAEMEETIIRNLAAIENKIRLSGRIVIIVEDCSRITDLKDFLSILLPQIELIGERREGLTVVIAAGAHYNLPESCLQKKYGPLSVPYMIHDATNQSELKYIGSSRSGIPLFFNTMVVEADLCLTISTLNIHPLLGFSGGAKILLPGVAGLTTIAAFHGLPPGKPGVYRNPMRRLLDEVLEYIPVDYSWQLLSGPDGKIIKIYGGDLVNSHRQGITELKKTVTVPNPKPPADLVLAGAMPFHQNLIGSFKALPQLIKLVRPKGTAILFNEASQGAGAHHWRMKPEVVAEQKNHYQQIFRDRTMAVYSPSTNEEDFHYLFPPNFLLLKEFSELTYLINGQPFETVTVLPYAPITLIAD